MILTTKQEKSLREAYKRQAEHYIPYENYRKNYTLRPLTAKFYARHETESGVTSEYEIPIEEIDLHIAGGPKDKSKWPMTTNQDYGWFAEPMVKIDGADRRLTHPRVVHDFIKHSLKLTKDMTMKQARFTGVPFLLQ